MIVQFVDIINRDETGNVNNFQKYFNNRCYHDRPMEIPEYLERPVMGGVLDGKRQVYILFFVLGPRTVSKKIRIRILNGTILNHTYGITREYLDEVSIDVDRLVNKQLAICFDCNPIYGNWVLSFGNETGIPFHKCPAYFDSFSLIRSSEPLNQDTMELPRFIISPQLSYEVLGGDLRGSIGQPYGRTIRHLKVLKVDFVRVKSYIIDDYFARVSTTLPHMIVPYPESVESIPPIWATLANPPSFTKRGENGWYWNCSLSWKEAY